MNQKALLLKIEMLDQKDYYKKKVQNKLLNYNSC